MTFFEQIAESFIYFPVDLINFLWRIINSIVIENWQSILVIIITLLAVASLKYFFTQRWGTLGSLLYNIFYFGIMYFIINKYGPEIILEDFFRIISFLVYVAGFFLTRLILNLLNVKNLPQFHY